MIVPPRFAMWLNELSIDPADREVVIGDLVEEFNARAQERPRNARMWFWWQTARSFGPNLRRRSKGSVWAGLTSTVKQIGGTMGLPMQAWLAVRGLLREPGFSVAAVATLALGIGASTALFGLVECVLLRPLPHVVDADEMITASTTMSYPLYRDIRDEAGAFDGVVGYQQRDVVINTAEGAGIGSAWVISGNFFNVLGVVPAFGRALLPEDDGGADSAVAVISDRFWQRQFARSGDVLGHSVVVNNISLRVVGVAPRDFRGMTLQAEPDLWIPISAWPRLATDDPSTIESRDWDWVVVSARLKRGVGLVNAEEVLNVIAQRDLVARSAKPRIQILPAGAAAAGGANHRQVKRFIALLAGIVACAFLMACANVANLMLLRSTRQRREFAIRRALGASTARVVSLLLTESVLLSATSAIVASIAAAWTLDLFRSFTLPGGISLDALDLRFDHRVFGVTVTLTAVSGALVGAFSAVHAARSDVLAALKDGTRGSVRSISRQVLIGLQVAVCLILLAGATLFLRSLQVTLSTDVGFDVDHTAVVSLAPSLLRSDRLDLQRTLQQVRLRLKDDRRIVGATWANWVPLSGDRQRETIDVEGYVRPSTDSRSVRFNAVGPDYFSTFGIPLRFGRDFTEHDSANAPLVAVVNESMSKMYWAGRSAVGGRVRLMGKTFSVVGVAADAVYESLDARHVPHVYIPQAQGPPRGIMSVIARTTGSPSGAETALRDAIAAVASDLPASTPQSLHQRFASTLMPQRFAATLLTAFGITALTLAVVGIYGASAYSVTQRTREIGVRIALGASSANVLWLIAAATMRPVLFGTIAGLIPAVLLSDFIGSFLPGISPLDPRAFGATLFMLVLAAATAAFAPTKRALGIDAARVLRAE